MSKKKLKKLLDKKKWLKKKWKVVALVIGILGLGFFFKNKLVVVFVNGQPIFRASYVKELEVQAGKQIIETLITKKLILQEAKSQKVKVTKQEIEEEIKTVEALADQQGLSLEQLLEFQGITKSQLEEEIKLQKTIKKIVGKDIEVSDEEINKYIEENREFLDEATSDEELKEVVSNQLKQQKLTEKVRELVGKLQQEAKIVSWL